MRAATFILSSGGALSRQFIEAGGTSSKQPAGTLSAVNGRGRFFGSGGVSAFGWRIPLECRRSFIGGGTNVFGWSIPS